MITEQPKHILPGTNQHSGRGISNPDLPPSLAQQGIDKSLAKRACDAGQVSKRVNSSNADADDATLIDNVALAVT
jgi:hypothetical protein